MSQSLQQFTHLFCWSPTHVFSPSYATRIFFTLSSYTRTCTEASFCSTLYQTYQILSQFESVYPQRIPAVGPS